MKIKIVILCLVLNACNSKQDTLPILSCYINDSGKKTSYTISNFHFTNQLNQPFTVKNIKDKVVLANFFFTRCPTICPKMKKSLKLIANDFKYENNFLIASITIDPKNDTVDILKSYSESTGILSAKWLFLNGSEKQLNHMAELLRTSYKREKKPEDIYHSTYAALIDKDQQIRGFYNLIDTLSVAHLKEDITNLLE